MPGRSGWLNPRLGGKPARLRLGPQKVGDGGEGVQAGEEGWPPPGDQEAGTRSSVYKELPGIMDSAQEGWFLTSRWPTAFTAQMGKLRPRGARHLSRSHSESEVKSGGNSDWPAFQPVTRPGLG